MKMGAVIVTTGLPRVSGVTALLPEVGAISAGQRMICGDYRMPVLRKQVPYKRIL
jgi:hypothetical protein